MKTTKSRIIFFAIALTYNLLLGLYLRDFLVLSQTLTAFYLLSALPTFFLLIEPRSGAMKAIVYIVLVLDILMNVIYYIHCRRLFAVMTMVFLVVELMYFIVLAIRHRKDNLLTKFVPVAKPTKKRCGRFTNGSYTTSSTTLTIPFANNHIKQT